MAESIVRLSEISIQNFKNVREGTLNFANRRKNYHASILGLYGQNGSGKTTLIDALLLLKYLLCGKSVPSEMTDYVHVDAEYASLKYTFDVTLPLGKYEAFYEVSIRKGENTITQNLDFDNTENPEPKAVVFDEVLSYSFESKDEKIRKSPFIDTRTERVFVPVPKYESFFGKDKALEMDLLVDKKIAASTSRSFVFSLELLKAAKKRESSQEPNTEFFRHLALLEKLIIYGHCEFFAITTKNIGMISTNHALPLAFKYIGKEQGAIGQIMLPLEAPAAIPAKSVGIVEKVIQNMNIVLEQIVPGLTIGIKNFGGQLLENGETGNRIQLISYKNNKEIPLKYESEGIKKIISVLQLLISIYNHPSITVAIDELDSGIFEYLLGELLRILSEKGRGQLIFTSHNLRPLETIDRGFIAFTTTNPSKRYIRFTNLKDNNNLRDFYFRDIVLGEQNEEVYAQTNNAEIAMAFREAGEIDAP